MDGDTLNGGQGGEGANGADAGDKSAELQQQLQQSNEKLAQAKLYAQLAQDPEFAQIMQARAAGRKVKITTDDQQMTSLADQFVPEPKEEVDLDKLDNKGLMQHLMRENAKVMEQIVNAKLQPVLQNVQQVQNHAIENVKQQKLQELNRVRQEYPDFDKHVARIIELSDDNPSLKPMQLYSIAKAEANEPIVKQRQISSERPSSVTGRPSSQQTRKNPLQAGMFGMRELLEEAGSRVANSPIFRDFDEE